MLDITKTIMSLTGITDEEEASILQERAESMIRLYLHYEEADSIQRFASSIVDIACIVYDQKQAEQEATGRGGLKSESFSEGGVSTKLDYSDSGSVASSYRLKIDNTLDYLKPYRRAHVVGSKKDADRK